MTTVLKMKKINKRISALNQKESQGNNQEGI